MELLQLRYFIETAKFSNVTRAAEAMHVAQPAVSQAIKRLENELGVELFKRKGRRIMLNDAGRILVKEIEPLLAALDTLPKKLQKAAGIEQHTIKVNVLSASRLVTNIIIAYKELHPEVHFIFIQDAESQDWDVRFTTEVSPSDKINSEEILNEEIFLAVPKKWLNISSESIALNDMADAPFIAFSEGTPFEVLCNSFCQSAGINPEVIFRSDNPSSVRDLIGAGLGVAFWPKYSWSTLPSDKVLLAHISDTVCRRSIVLSKNYDFIPGSCHADFYNFIFEYVRDTFTTKP